MHQAPSACPVSVQPVRRDTARRYRYAWALVLAAVALASACGGRDAPGVPPAGRGSFAFTSEQPALDRLQDLIRDTLEANRKEFAGSTGVVAGFGAGALYPQIWLRDSATLVQVSRYVYPRRYLTSWIEEHLAHQRDDGSLFDWIAAGEPSHFRTHAPLVVGVHHRGRVALSADRNSAASDQEASAVLGAAQAFEILGDRSWLTRRIAGRPLIDRLAGALEYMETSRIDRRTGLVTEAFTADWGDVTPVYPDQRAIYRDGATPVVGSLYASVMFSAAAQALSGLYKSIGDGRGAGRWHVRARRTIDAIERTLWREDDGFYRIHQLLQAPHGWNAPADEAFALGGNAVALLYGIADDAKVGRVLAAAAARQAEYGMPTISGVLLPPFPAGTFQHPQLREPYEYQNGGQWDWWGGRLLLAAFERGHADTARRELARVAEQTARMGGLYEWSTRDGDGRGSRTYAGTGGVLGAAILRGLYGIDLRHDRLDVHVRLAEESGSVRVHEPSTRTVVRYEYVVAPSRRSAVLEYEASVAGRGTLALRLPAERTGAAVRRDAGPAERLETVLVGHDRYITFETDWSRHRLEIVFD